MPKIPKSWMKKAGADGSNYSDDILNAGKYSFLVTKAWEETASTGNECIALSLDVTVGTTTYKIYDRLWFTEAAAFKIHAFCKAAGLAKIIADGGVLSCEDCVNVKGMADVAIEDATSQYPERNVVANYLAIDEAGPVTPEDGVTTDEPDIPF